MGRFARIFEGVRVQWVGIARHKRDDDGRIYFERCGSTRTDCRARPDHLATFIGRGGDLVTAMLCWHHAEEVDDGPDHA